MPSPAAACFWVTRIALPPMPAGTYDFLCDNFCGDGHESMHGRLVVSA